MRTAIIGAGPTGLFTGIGLARRGHDVSVVDRDPGPDPDGTWPRRGVMQFHHAHGFRGQVHESLRREAPESLRRWLEAGAEPVRMIIPGGREVVAAVRSRRQTFEAALRDTARRQGGLRLVRGHVDRVTVSDGTASGVLVDGTHLPADLVVDASGRSGRTTREIRTPPLSGGPCGLAYTDRVYRLRAGAEPGTETGPLAWGASLDGYQVLVFPHELGFFSVVILRNTADRDLRMLRHRAAFDAACRVIPGLCAWTDPDRSEPASDVLPGGMLVNHYRGQTGPDGRLALPGLVFVGDAVCTTTPNFGRGVTTSLLQAEELLRTIDQHGSDLVAVGESFDAWCHENMKPWVDDHAYVDDWQRRRWAGEDVDLSRRLPSDLVVAGAEGDPALADAVFRYVAMLAGPSSLDPVEPRVRQRFARGWRPAFDPGPDRGELAEVIAAAVPS